MFEQAYKRNIIYTKNVYNIPTGKDVTKEYLRRRCRMPRGKTKAFLTSDSEGPVFLSR